VGNIPAAQGPGPFSRGGYPLPKKKAKGNFTATSGKKSTGEELLQGTSVSLSHRPAHEEESRTHSNNTATHEEERRKKVYNRHIYRSVYPPLNLNLNHK
jgi:hypothetical protein